MKNTIVIFSSSRRNGNTGKLTDWAAPCAQMKIFIDRLPDLLDVAQLKRLGKRAYILSTSINEDASENFINSFNLIFKYFDMNLVGYLHDNCNKCYLPHKYHDDVRAFLAHFRS